jgi:glycosyltransferase involved in cell wall biosynthesis
MRILYLATDLSTSFGGIETYGRELAEGIRSRGHEVRIRECDPGRLLGNLRLLDRVPWPYTWSRYYHWRGFFHQDYRYHNAVWRALREEVREFRPDVVHCLHVYLGACTLGRQLPSLVSCYGLEVLDCPPTRQTFGAVGAIHAISHFTAGLATGVNPANREKVEVLSWGVRDPFPRPAGESDYDLVTVGRLVPRKNIDTVLRALQEMPEVRYAVVGDGPEREGLERLARDLGLTNVSFLGQMTDDEKYQVMTRSRAFVMCPRHKPDDVEGLGLVYFEAQRCGLPTIAARSGGVPDAVGDAGVLIDNPTDPVELRRAIRAVLEPTTYAQLRGRVAVRQREHSWDRFLTSFEDLYRRVIESHNGHAIQQTELARV